MVKLIFDIQEAILTIKFSLKDFTSQEKICLLVENISSLIFSNFGIIHYDFSSP